jgi:hypothetical protein
MSADERMLEDLAAHLAQGEEIDWEEASRRAGSAHARSAVAHLRAVHRLRDFATATDLEERATRPSIGSGPTDADLGRWGHLILREVLDQGAQGTVYRAWDPELECDVALKLDCEDHIGLGEARRLARIRHPHVVRVHGAARHDGRYGLWMEYIRGRTLAERIAQDGPLGEDEAVEVGRKLASALVAVHAVNVVHQDIKARNVMREEGGRFVLMDLGCGADLDKGQEAVGGTPYYMAPETLRGARPSKRADVYGLGVLLYHLVTGDFPFRGHDLSALRRAHRAERPRSLLELRPDCSPGFVAVVEKAIAVDPRARYADAASLLRGLEDLSQRPAIVSRPAWPRRMGRRIGFAAARVDRRARWTAAAILLVAVATGAWWQWLQPRLEVEVALQRWSGSVREEIDDGSRVGPGDLLALRIRGNRPLYVHAFGLDEEGGLRRLFPLDGTSLHNPLAPHASHTLPGEVDGRPMGWRVASAGGAERILVVALAHPNPELEALAAALPGIGDPSPDDLGPTRGLGGTAGLPGGAGQDAEELLARIRATAGSGRWSWIRELVLPNP